MPPNMQPNQTTQQSAIELLASSWWIQLFWRGGFT